jgi:RimJ/RimL family protein N-acetyltransferase
VRTEPELVQLAADHRILVRQISSDDKRLLADAFERLSPETRYRRFFSPLTRLSEQDLRYLTEVDHHDHEALVALDPENGELVGVARYVRSDDPGEAEVAVVVDDRWQRNGVASSLLERLVARAREEDIDHFLALVMRDNVEALELFRNLSPDGSWTRPSASGHVELVIDLPGPGFRLSETRLGQVLRTVAREAPVVNPWRVFRRAILRRPTEEMKLPGP